MKAAESASAADADFMARFYFSRDRTIRTTLVREVAVETIVGAFAIVCPCGAKPGVELPASARR